MLLHLQRQDICSVSVASVAIVVIVSTGPQRIGPVIVQFRMLFANSCCSLSADAKDVHNWAYAEL